MRQRCSFREGPDIETHTLTVSFSADGHSGRKSGVDIKGTLESDTTRLEPCHPTSQTRTRQLTHHRRSEPTKAAEKTELDSGWGQVLFSRQGKRAKAWKFWRPESGGWGGGLHCSVGRAELDHPEEPVLGHEAHPVFLQRLHPVTGGGSYGLNLPPEADNPQMPQPDWKLSLQPRAGLARKDRMPRYTGISAKQRKKV